MMHSRLPECRSSHWESTFLLVGTVSHNVKSFGEEELNLPLVKERGDTALFDGMFCDGNEQKRGYFVVGCGKVPSSELLYQNGFS